MRAFLAVLGGSALAALVATTALAIYNIAVFPGPRTGFVSAMAGFFVGAYVTTALAASTLGLLWHWFAQRRGRTGLHTYWIPAVLVGLAPPIFLMLTPLNAEVPPSVNGTWMHTFALLLILGTLLGGLTAVFAWLIRRPDRDKA